MSPSLIVCAAVNLSTILGDLLSISASPSSGTATITPQLITAADPATDPLYLPLYLSSSCFCPLLSSISCREMAPLSPARELRGALLALPADPITKRFLNAV